jgi:diadenosine tetraphosphate (Ap4A) HIT family hydrolase
MTSPFTLIPVDQHVAANDLAFAVRDANPVSRGHTLVVPRREIATWFDATPDEHAALAALVGDVREQLDAEVAPDGYTLGVNVGEAAGQTVMHLHVHVIPRWTGDVAEPRGGVRGVLPERRDYPVAP